MKKYNEGKYADARVGFEKILKISKTHSLSDNAQYWIGQSYYDEGIKYDSLADTVNAKKSFTQAILNFNEVKKFKDKETPKIEDAAYQIPKTYFAMGDKRKAEEEAVRFLAFYPESKNGYKIRELLISIREKQIAIKPDSISNPPRDSTSDSTKGGGNPKK